MKPMNKAQQIAAIVLRITQDGEEHSIAEFRAAILAEAPALLSAPNTLSAALYEIQRAHPRLQRTRKGCYRLQGGAPGEEQRAPFLTAHAAIAKLRDACAEIDRMLRQPDYTMSAEEFMDYKQAHQLNQKIQKLLEQYQRTRSGA